MSTLTKKNFNEPDETNHIGRMKVEKVTIGNLTFSKQTAAPGWQWAEDLKPVVKTESCQVNHLIYVISGKINTKMDDGTELELSAGDIATIPPGHNGWTVGDEPAVWIEIPQ